MKIRVLLHLLWGFLPLVLYACTGSPAQVPGDATTASDVSADHAALDTSPDNVALDTPPDNVALDAPPDNPPADVTDRPAVGAFCGDGIVEPGEQCDPMAFTLFPCASLSPAFAGGTVRCSSGCALDLSGCMRVPSICGNGVVEGAEQCDDANPVDSDGCANNCQLRFNGQRSFVEPPSRAAPDGILEPMSACRAPATRMGARSRAPARVRYRLHLCQLDDGTNIFPTSEVRALLGNVRSLFMPAGIQLEEESVVTFQYQNCSPTYEDTAFWSERRRVTPTDIVPLVFVQTIPSSTSEFNIGGYARQGTILVNAGLGYTVIVHELGHFFGLGHTHACAFGRETMSTCSMSGDFLCDTPPDRGPRGIRALDRCSDGSTLNGSCEGGCGVGICDDGAQPDRSNFMSYYHCPMATISPEQMDYMRCTLDNELQRYNAAATTGRITVSAPATSAVFRHGDRITLTWTSSGVTGPLQVVVRTPRGTVESPSTMAPTMGSQEISVAPTWGTGNDFEVCLTGDSGRVVGCSGRFTVTCMLGRVSCDGRCTDVTTDSMHCGRCGNACASGARCADSVCGGTPAACGAASGPSEQQTDLRICRLHHPRRATDRDATGWFQAVADAPGATVQVLSATLYGLRADGSLVPIAGSDLGQSPISWAGLWSRSPWFPPGDAHTTVMVPSGASPTFAVPTNRVLHGGGAHADISAYQDAVYVMTVRTTGGARVQIGVDYRPSADSMDVNERSLSDWFACATPGGSITRTTPRASAPTECAVAGDCPSPTQRCGTVCVNLDSDANHCGMCGRRCATGQMCVARSCIGASGVPMIRMSSPDNGSTFAHGSSFNAVWEASDITGVVRVVVRRLGTEVAVVTTTGAANGSQSVMVPTTWVAGGGYDICASASSALGTITSCRTFSVMALSMPSISMTSPSNGSSFAQGASFTATWTSTNVTEPVRVVVRRAGTEIAVVTTSGAASASQSVTVQPSWTAGNDYEICASATTAAGTITSCRTFSVTSLAMPSIRLTSPADGGSHARGTSFTAEWSATDITSPVRVVVRRAGTEIAVVTTSGAANGSQSVTVQSSWGTGGGYDICASADGATGTVTSCRAFSVVDAAMPTLNLSSPSSGSSFAQGASFTAIWSATDITGLVRVVVRRSGSEIAVVTTTGAANSSQSVTVQSSWGTGSGYDICASAPSSIGTITSCRTFSIMAAAMPTIRMTSPGDGGSYAQGASFTAAWSATDITGSVRVVVRRFGSEIAVVTTTGAPGDSVSVRVSSSWGAGGGYDICASAPSSIGTVTSCRSFSITSSAPSIVMTSPSDGGSYARGSSFLAAWTATNTTGFVRVVVRRFGTEIATATTTGSAVGSQTIGIPTSWTVGSGYDICASANSSSGTLTSCRTFSVR